jgi:hypothetical protein
MRASSSEKLCTLSMIKLRLWDDTPAAASPTKIAVFSATARPTARR